MSERTIASLPPQTARKAMRVTHQALARVIVDDRKHPKLPPIDQTGT